MAGFLAGASAVRVDPPPGLPMVGFVRRHERAEGIGAPLEVTAVALEANGARAVVAGVDTLGIQAPEADVLRDRVAAAADAAREAVLLNWNHTHCAPPGGRSIVNLGGDMADVFDDDCLVYIDRLHDSVVEAARLAAEGLEPARPLWGVGRAEGAVNRREHNAEGRVILGWNPEGPVDLDVPVLQLRRPDESAVATIVGYGCHTVTVGWNVLAYDSDFVGPLRDLVRAATGGECVFLQGAAGNILPLYAFRDDRAEAERLGRRLGVAALAPLVDRSAWPGHLEKTDSGSVTPISIYRRVLEPDGVPALAAAEEVVSFALQPLPTPDEIAELRKRFEAATDAARAGGEPAWLLNTLRYNSDWARRTEEAIREGTAPRTADGPVGALRVGDGAIVTGPGEVFTEIGLAVRSGSPADVTLYAGYTNGAVSYLPTAAAFSDGGYEPDYGNRTYGLPAQVTPDCERQLIETSLRVVRGLFPEWEGS